MLPQKGWSISGSRRLDDPSVSVRTGACSARNSTELDVVGFGCDVVDENAGEDIVCDDTLLRTGIWEGGGGTIMPVRCVIAVFEKLEDDAVAEHGVENVLRSNESAK